MTVIINIADAQKFHFLRNFKRCTTCVHAHVCVSRNQERKPVFFFVLKVHTPLPCKCSCVNGLLSFNEAFTELFQYQNYVQSREVFLQKI